MLRWGPDMEISEVLSLVVVKRLVGSQTSIPLISNPFLLKLHISLPLRDREPTFDNGIEKPIPLTGSMIKAIHRRISILRRN